MKRSKPVLLEIDPPVAIIQLNRAEVHHAIDRAMMELLDEYTRRIEAHGQVRVGILTARGNTTFCAGGDLRFFSTLTTRESGLHLSRRMQTILNRIWQGHIPFIAAINGAALGGGCELMTACHIRLAAEHARFSYRQAANGLITGWGGGVRLFRILGPGAIRLLITSESISAEQALRLGLIDQVVAAPQLLSETRKLASTIARNSPGAVAAFLEILRAVSDGRWETARFIETNRFADLWTSPEFRRFLNHFLNSQET